MNFLHPVPSRGGFGIGFPIPYHESRDFPRFLELYKTSRELVRQYVSRYRLSYTNHRLSSQNLSLGQRTSIICVKNQFIKTRSFKAFRKI